ncbi:MAG: ABC transporter ATP-binding protein/permease [Phyllobacterium sp.]|uniref:ABC transporter ATP-binding protein/permease n=1 Tax=Phyllobacterium sp. TaxID=1871046 RepID=UPI0030F1C260
MRTFWGLMRAYWVSGQWMEAWTLSAAIALLTAASSKASVWMAEASGEFLNSLVNIHDPFNQNPLGLILTNAGVLVLLLVMKEAGFVGLRHLLSTTLHRKWRGWLNARFNDALLDANHAHYHLQQGDREAMPDNIDQRMQESIKGMTGGAIGLSMGVLGVAMSVIFVGQKLIEMSTEVGGLEFLGSYGSAVLAFSAIAVYVPLSTWIAVRIGRVLEQLTLQMQQTEGSYRSELTTFLRRSFQVAASGGEGVQRRVNARVYAGVDGTWAKLNVFDAAYLSFTAVYNFFAARVVAYLPGLLPYMSNTISLKSYITGAELVGSMINECSWFIQVMPAIANLKANVRRITELACAVDAVGVSAAFYRTSGVSEFAYSTQHELFGLTLKNVELMHRSDEAFLKADHIHFHKGDWIYLRGESGCGKTSLLKAMNGLWPYGRGEIIFPENARTMYAAQEVKLPGVTLKQLISLPLNDAAFSDAAAAAALHRAGMGEFIEHLAQEERDGTSWDLLLSGGQKQKLVLARILLHKPSILFLDEATGALDPESKIAFHQAIKDNCRGVTVISVMHELEPPKSVDGQDFYSRVLDISSGRADLNRLRMVTVHNQNEDVVRPLIAAE